jgi:protein-tyrosine-phosphatase
VKDIPEVLFVCVHNAGRSQMVAALLDYHPPGLVPRSRCAGLDQRHIDGSGQGVGPTLAAVGIMRTQRPDRGRRPWRRRALLACQQATNQFSADA